MTVFHRLSGEGPEILTALAAGGSVTRCGGFAGRNLAGPGLVELASADRGRVGRPKDAKVKRGAQTGTRDREPVT